MSVDTKELALWLFNHEQRMNFVGGPKYPDSKDIDIIIKHTIDNLSKEEEDTVQFEIASLLFKKHEGRIDLYVKVGEVD